MYQRQVTFDEAIKLALGPNYCNFQGRSSRSEYWWFQLFSFIIGAGISLLFGDGTTGNIISGLLGLVFLLPSLGLAVRRLHDIGKGGGYIFVNLIPLLGTIWFVIMMATESEQTPNRFGPEPNVME